MNTETITIGAFEAKTRLAELLDEVGSGVSYTITKRNHPVARLMGIETNDLGVRAEATASLRAMRTRYRLKGLNVRKLREEGRA